MKIAPSEDIIDTYPNKNEKNIETKYRNYEDMFGTICECMYNRKGTKLLALLELLIYLSMYIK